LAKRGTGNGFGERGEKLLLNCMQPKKEVGVEDGLLHQEVKLLCSMETRREI